MHRQNRQVAAAGAGHLAQLLRDAAHHQRAGRFPLAEKACRQILDRSPGHAEALYRLGMLSAQQGRDEEATGYLAGALKADPTQPHVWLSLVTTLLARERIGEARALIERFNSFHPPSAATAALTKKLVDLLLGHGLQHHKAKRIPEAELIYDTILLLDGNHPGAIHLAGLAAWHKQKLDDAAALLETSIGLDDTKVDVHTDLASIYMAQKRWHLADRSWTRAFELGAENVRFIAFHAQVLKELGRAQETVDLCHRSLALKPGYRPARMLLCQTLRDMDRLDDVLDEYRSWIADEPTEPAIHNNLGNVLKDMGRSVEAVACFRESIRLAPDVSLTYSNLLAVSHYLAGLPPEELTEEARRWGRTFSEELPRTKPFENVLDSDRPLRIGFVSADFRVHAVSNFLEPFLLQLDRRAFEVFGYSNFELEDVCTVRLKELMSGWHNIVELDDDAAAALIENNRIDILIDLSSHTTGHRFSVFARKPAPIQASWIGFPMTTGLPAIDYLLAGATVGPGMEAYSTETVWRLPHLGMTFQPNQETPDPLDVPPCDTNGFVTFGYINNVGKVTDEMVEMWGRLLARVPESRLFVVAEIGSAPRFRAELEARLAEAGIPPERQILVPRTREHYKLYHSVDIALDSMPFNGCTTSMDTLWMGVPFVTMRGFHQASRVGEVILDSVGLSELVGENPDHFVEVAAALALDRERLRAIRQDLRGRTQRSPLMDHASMARHVEDAFRQMWRIWVDKQDAHRADGLAA